MIEINRYCEAMIEVMNNANNDLPIDSKIREFIISPTESGLLQKIKDKDGILFCSSYPPCDTDATNSDATRDSNTVLLFILERVSAGSMDNNDEREHFGKMQRIAEKIVEKLVAQEYGCDKNFRIKGGIHLEWEYNYGGANGLSMAFNLEN